MLTEKCDPKNHQWVCGQQEGRVGEIKATRFLTTEDVNKLSADRTTVDEICPNGLVYCVKCKQPFFSDQEYTSRQAPDIKGIIEGLKGDEE